MADNKKATKKDAILDLMRKGVRNMDIAQTLGVDRSYISYLRNRGEEDLPNPTRKKEKIIPPPKPRKLKLPVVGNMPSLKNLVIKMKTL